MRGGEDESADDADDADRRPTPFYVCVDLPMYPCQMDPKQIVHSDPEIVSGTPVFVGTRVPAKALLDYLEGGETINEFLDDFPSVSREQAVAFLEEAGQALLARIA